MTLEDPNITQLMNDIKTQRVPIVDEDYIDYELKNRGLSYEDAEKMRDKELKRLLQIYTVQNAAILQRNEQRRERREQGERGVEPGGALPPTPEVPDTFEPFTDDERKTINEYHDAFLYYSKVLQCTLNKSTKREPYRFAIQCKQNNSSGFETWRRLHVTCGQGEKAQQLQTLRTTQHNNHNELIT
eukprot:5898565-Amphidinium_carterae.1